MRAILYQPPVGVFLFSDTKIYFAGRTRYVGRMLRRVTRMNRVSKASFGAGMLRAVF
jgi:hypothetical protein